MPRVMEIMTPLGDDVLLFHRMHAREEISRVPEFQLELLSMNGAPSGKAHDAIRLIRALLRSGSALAGEISEIDVARADGPVLYTVGGIEVRLGPDEWDERLARLEADHDRLQRDLADAHERLDYAERVIARDGSRAHLSGN